MANCNLHNQAVGEGISAVVQDLNIQQYIEQQQHSDVSRLLPAGQGQVPGQPAVMRRSVWLEAGSINLNLITADIALAADHSAKCEVQRQYLELHDTLTKRYINTISHLFLPAKCSLSTLQYCFCYFIPV